MAEGFRLFARDESTYPTDQLDITTAAMVSPMILVGWGFDINGSPTPMASGSHTFEVLHKQRPDIWNAGPMDIRWDHKRRVYCNPGIRVGINSGVDVQTNQSGEVAIFATTGLSGPYYDKVYAFNWLSRTVKKYKKTHLGFNFDNNQYYYVDPDC